MISVIVPVYNVKPYLDDCVRSLLAQTVPVEIILVDDGSTDGSALLCERYAEEYPDTVRSLRVENGGQGRARNIGIGMARGEYLGFVDSDDWVEPTMYEKLLRVMESERAELAYCDFMGRYDDGHTELLPARLHENKMSAAGSACNKLFKRELVGELRFPEGLWYEDFAFSALVLMKAERVAYVREPLYLYRCGQPSTMHNHNARKNLDILAIMDILENSEAGRGRKDELEFMLINHALLDTCNRLLYVDSPDRAEALLTVREYVRQRIPRLSGCRSYRKETGKRRLIMFLHYHGLSGAAKAILDAKKAMS